MGVPDSVKKLVEKFSEDSDRDFLRETQIRQYYIDPLFECLGWDVNARNWRGQTEREVVLEDRIRVSDRMRAPDYGFYLNNSRRFFVEAKRTQEDLHIAKSPAFQLRSYGWSAGLALSILTDFEEFVVYDCRVKPDQNDATSVAREEYLTFDKYEERWGDIYDLFSKESVGKGSLDAFSPRKKKGTDPVDRAFLRQIEAWRKLLAEDIHRASPTMNRYDLNYAVQTTIDRLVFLRVCEDRGTEQYETLWNILGSPNVYASLMRLFRDADNRYNSGLFHFHREAGRGEPDLLTPELEISDGVLKDIIGGLYPPKSPYQFSVMPVEILGQTYEQFLGSVITIEDGVSGGVTVEQKPEVRKAGGVYYTPEYIVDYIVENTIGELVKGKTPRQVANMRFVDPACGSGSFLIGAYDFLLDWHLKTYAAEPEKHPDRIYEYRYGVDDQNTPPRQQKLQAGEWRLTVSEKKRILTNNLYGVDIDPQAVEVTKLSLLLKVLEGEDGQTTQLSMERILPDLENNIKCGNSLIGHDFYDQQQGKLFDQDEQRRINTFDWNSSFPAVFRGKNPGFDAVIGNPPYIDSEWMTSYKPVEREYCTKTYDSASGNWDIFCVFVEKTMQVCKKDGLTSLILPNKLGSAEYAAAARKIVANENILNQIRDYSRVPVFPVAVYPIVYVAQKNSSRRTQSVGYSRVEVGQDKLFYASVTQNLSYERYFSNPKTPWAIFSSLDEVDPVATMLGNSISLGLISTVSGAATVAEAYEIKPLIEAGGEISTSQLKVANSGTIDRYLWLWSQKPLRYIKDTYVNPIINSESEKKLPKKRLTQARTPKIVIASMTKYLECSIDSEGEFLAGKSTTVVFSSTNLEYLLGLLNSKAIDFYYSSVYGGNRLQGGYLRIGPPQVKSIPVRTIDFSNPDDVAKHDRMVTLVERMLRLQGELQGAQSVWDRDRIKGSITATDYEIDHLVYELYGLSDEEIELVEAAE